MKSQIVAAALAAGVCVGCGDRAESQSIPPEYRFLGEFSVSNDEAAALRAGLPYEKIELEYFSDSWPYGPDKVTLLADGEAYMIDGKGRWKGKTNLLDFGYVCYLLETHGFEDMQPGYSRMVFDALTIAVRAWPRGATDPISVESYANAAPLEFRMFETSINGVARRVRWQSDAQQAAPTDGPSDRR